MKHHKITKREDSEELQKWYEVDAIFAIFEILETGEETTLADFLYNADWDGFEAITIQHI